MFDKELTREAAILELQAAGQWTSAANNNPKEYFGRLRELDELRESLIEKMEETDSDE